MKAPNGSTDTANLHPSGLGHVGLACEDLPKMRDFYTRVVGMSVTDEAPGMVFLSSQPESEHHELLLGTGRTAPRDTRLVGQISFHVENLQVLQAYVSRLKEEQVPIRNITTHGIAIGCYFSDPEDNIIELYWATGKSWKQPYGKSINVEQPVDAVLAEQERLLAGV
ncbi:MAG TPA: VOC family protein [Chloroflexota bacterium]|nr:VOC family protein [Chloroflexota bacterium]